ncbi:MAG: tetratricopeptide repeat protein, partial [Candidatus Dadabacteria bacterium]
MKKLIYLFCFFILAENTSAQVDSVDAVLRNIISEKSDVLRIKRLYIYFISIQENDPLKTQEIAQHLLVIGQRLKDKHVEAFANSQLAHQSFVTGNSTKSLEYGIKALKIAEQLNNVELLAIAKNRIGHNYQLQPARALNYYKEAYQEAVKAVDYNLMTTVSGSIGRSFLRMNELDSALIYLHLSEQLNLKYKVIDAVNINAAIYYSLATIYAEMKNSRLAVAYFNSAINEAKKSGSPRWINYAFNSFAEFYFKTNQTDSTISYAKKAIETVQNTPYSYLVLNPSKLLTDIYRNKNNDSAMKYADMYVTANNSVNNLKTIQQNQLLTFEEQLRQKTIADEKLKMEEQRHQNIQYASIAIGIIIFIIVFLLLSRSIVVNERFISFFAVLGFLIFFEYVNLLIHSWLADFTHESPL